MPPVKAICTIACFVFRASLNIKCDISSGDLSFKHPFIYPAHASAVHRPGSKGLKMKTLNARWK